jgi:type IV conjugative transfer system coupling protein TraD
MMMKIFEYYIQQSQTQIHRLRMFKQVVFITLSLAFIVTLISIVICSYLYGLLAHILWLLAYSKAWVRLTLLNFLQQGLLDTSYLYQNESFIAVRDITLYSDPDAFTRFEALKITLCGMIERSLILGTLSFIAITLYWFLSGRKHQRKKILKGQKIVQPSQLKKLVKQYGTSPIQLAGIPIPQGAECEHMMITGTTGAGKTNAIQSLLYQIRQLGHKAIIVDTSGNLVEKFFQHDSDTVLNPFDSRTAHWNLWSDCRHDYEFDELAESLIPTDHHDTFWTKAARQLFSSVAIKLKNEGQTTLPHLLHLLLEKPFDEIAVLLKDTDVSAYVDASADKMALSIRATLLSALRNLKYLKDSSASFSIQGWIQKETSSNWLFLSSTPNQRETLKPLISAWLSLAVKSLMEAKENRERRIWFIIDELASLHQLPILLRGLSEIRRFGGCFVLAFQDLNQLDRLYGAHTARTFGNLIGTKVIFRLDSHAAKHIATLFGEQEVHDVNKSISFGAHEVRDGVSLTDRQSVKPLITPIELTQQKKLQAYIKFLGNFPITQVIFPLVH